MRIVAFDKNGQSTLAVRVADELIDLSVAAPQLPTDLKSLLSAGNDIIADIEKAVANAGAEARSPAQNIRYQLPIANPGKIICLGLNYADHAKEGGHAKPEYPSFFMRGPSSLVAHEQPIIRTRLSDTLDYEAELVAIVGARAPRGAKVDPLSVIAGYSVFNDGSVRQYQRKTSQWTIGKNFDATGGFGPEFVSADELPPGATGLRIQSRLNGQIMQDDNTDNMLFDVAETIQLLTDCMTLEPGDLIVMGTPAGVGHARKPPVFMQHGDICEIEIEQVGLLRNPIVNEAS